MDLLDMDEAALLAELQAISSRHASPPRKTIQLSLVQRHSPAVRRNRSADHLGLAPSDEVDGTSFQEEDDEDDLERRVVERAPSGDVPHSSPPVTNTNPPSATIAAMGIPSQSTFQGERGGAAEDAELLALLRCVSNQSSSASRFQNDAVEGEATESVAVVEPPISSVAETTVSAALPPWKRRGNRPPSKVAVASVVVDDAPVIVASDSREEVASEEVTNTKPPSPPVTSMGIPSQSTFQGERGGAAEDAELLALLRGVSNQSSSASRFLGDVEATESVAVVEPPIRSVTETTASASLPPWKRRGNRPPSKAVDAKVIVSDTVESKDEDRNSNPPKEATDPPKAAMGIPSQSSFQGERGGSAEDAELLALLRGVSNQSSSASRFQTEGDVEATKNASTEPSSNATETAVSASLPPWKRRGNHLPSKVADTKVMVVSDTIEEAKEEVRNSNPPPSEEATNSNPPPITAMGIPSQSTFQGERGGAAEDAELLALLRGVSIQSSSASRFQTEEEVFTEDVAVEPPISVAETSVSASLPPWKRRGNRPPTKVVGSPVIVVSRAPEEAKQDEKVMNTNPSPPIAMGIPSQSTFQGERGGAAEDAELLALLRGVSNQSSAQRFNENDGSSEEKTIPSYNTSQLIHTTETSAFTPTIAEGETSQVLPADEVPKSLSDKNWKVRCQAYDTLTLILCDHVKNGGQDVIDSDSVMNGLDERVPSFVEDTNAGALDKALEFCVLYAEHCRGAGRAEQAQSIVSSLIRKNAFSSRPSTLKLSNTLALNLMEVGLDGAASVHAVVEVLISEGLSSKKPKVIQASVSLIVEAMYHFGAASLPLATITEAAPKMLSHSNATVRDGCIQILAEICRTLGSKAPILKVLEGMKKAQLMDLDKQLTEQPEATPIRTGLRSNRQQGNATASTPADALAALQAGSKELEAQRYAAREPVDVVAAMARTDYADQIVLSKWSEKVAALDKVLECGGEKPYKLVPPSSTVTYGPLISDMKKLLGHTHFAVCGRAIQVLSMLAQGVGEKLYPHLRPMLTPLLQLSKDKKLTNDVSSGLDVMFGNVLSFENLLDEEDAIPSMVNEKNQKNALARATALNFLQSCVVRRDSAGPKGTLSPQTTSKIATLCATKLDDSDASVRKAALSVFEALLKVDDAPVVASVQKLLEQLRTSNPRAYKALSSTDPAELKTHVAPPAVTVPSVRSRSAAPSKRPPSPAAKSVTTVDFPSTDRSMEERTMPHLEEALIHITGLSIPQWDASEDDGGILSGLKALKWQLRHDAIELLRSFIDSGDLEKSSKDVEQSISCILFIVREQTRGFKETNVNIMKAILHLCISVCDFFESKELPLPKWAMKDMASVGVQKISDRKLMTSCQKLLTAGAVVSIPSDLLHASFEELKSVKSPVAHEEFLRWFQTFCNDFGAMCIGRGISDLIPYLIEEFGSVNAKVKKEALACFALLHRQIGPGLKSLAVSLAKQSSTKEQFQKCFEENPFEPSLSSATWPKVSFVGKVNRRIGNGESIQSLVLDIPTVDLFATLPADIISKLGSKEGKTAWKMRKEALDEIEAGLKNCSGLLNTAPAQMKQLSDLTRGLRDRLTDLQINLRPSAARLVGSLLSLVDKSSQAKLGKLVFPALVNEAMNDIKKPMRDASIEAIQTSIKASQLDGGGVNVLSLEALVVALVSEVNEAAVRASGLPDVLMLVLSIVDYIPSLECVTTSRGAPIGEKYAAMLIECLTSSKSETRSAAVSLLDASVEKDIVSLESIKKATDRLKPALQRSVGPIIAKMAKKAPASCRPEANSSTTTSVNGIQKTMKSSDGKEGPYVYPPVSVSRFTESMTNPVPLSSPSKLSASHPRHPLVSESSKQNSSLSRSIIWTEYPEEPHGSLLENLKRGWSPLLPAATASALFPISGIRKQDDAKAGIEALVRALSIDRLEGGSCFVDQLAFILKWIMFVICSKESTVGLQDILALLKDSFVYLIETERELNDSEALESVPFLIDKLSGAKGRFRDFFSEIYTLIENEKLLSPKRLEICCVAVIESSPHARAKAQACQTCIGCIEKTGLAGLGKKGVLATAKMLSQDTTTHRVAALDLLESILSKMNGDITRLVRICGPNLNDKARQLLEDRWYKNQARDNSLSHVSNGSPGHRIQTGSPHKTIAMSFHREERPRDIFDELPRLSLRASGKEPTKPSPRKKLLEDISDEPYVFNFSVTKSASPSNMDLDLVETSSETALSYFNSTETEPSGAAAALRARLLKIREKGNAFGIVDPDVAEADNMTRNFVTFDDAFDSIRKLLKQPTPASENDPHVLACIESLKLIHASLSRDIYSTIDISDAQLSDLRHILAQNVDDTIGLIRSLIGFSINSGNELSSSGMLLSLLSLCLATLMALFRDDDFSMLVSATELALLIRDTGTALLDDRLTSSDELSEDDRSQVVRAINKLAVQAATSSARHTSFQALLNLQKQLKNGDVLSDESFKSRLSRVVVKLFARVVKAEESVLAPYTSGGIDMEALLCSMEDSLEDSKLDGSNLNEPDVCAEMVTSLLRSITVVHGNATGIRRQMQELDIDPNNSALGVLLTKFSETWLSDDAQQVFDPKNLAVNETVTSSLDASQSAQPKTPSKDVATLVSRLARAPPGEEREAALTAIRAYKLAYGREELDAHLLQLSGAFREFIVEQINREPSPQKQSLPLENAGSSVSERIRSLRSRLQASEANQKTAINEAPDSQSTTPRIPEPPVVSTGSSSIGTVVVSNLVAPSPSKLLTLSGSKPATPGLESKLPVPGHSRLMTSTTSTSLSSAQSLRERLAARQAMMQLQTENNNDSSISYPNPVDEHVPGASKPSMGRAAALRARLELVKQQSRN